MWDSTCCMWDMSIKMRRRWVNTLVVRTLDVNAICLWRRKPKWLIIMKCYKKTTHHFFLRYEQIVILRELWSCPKRKKCDTTSAIDIQLWRLLWITGKIEAKMCRHSKAATPVDASTPKIYEYYMRLVGESVDAYWTILHICLVFNGPSITLQ